MKVAITGTPGTGKSTVANLVDAGFRVVHINDLINERYNTGRDEVRGCLIADLEALAEYVQGLAGDLILEGHTAHLLPVDIIIVLRASPAALKARLGKRGWSASKVRENIEAEALDVILTEALETDKKVYEIDTTNMTPMQTKEAVLEAIRGTEKYRPGNIDFSEEAFL